MKPKKVEMLKCNDCDALVYEDDVQTVDAFKSSDGEEISEDADDLVEEITASKCPECREIAGSQEDLFDYVDAFECSECGEIYEDKEEAKQCCK
jgi:acetyl-CoA carboxylase beta subunit